MSSHTQRRAAKLKTRRAQPADTQGADLGRVAMLQTTKKSIRGICRDLVGQHSSEMALRIREGALSKNLRLALKYLTFVSDRTDGRPVETHRMVGLHEGPAGAYDLSKLKPAEQKQLLALLRSAKDSTESKGSV